MGTVTVLEQSSPGANSCVGCGLLLSPSGDSVIWAGLQGGSHGRGSAVMAKAGWEWWRCAGETQAGQRCHIPAWPEAGSKVLGAAGNVAGLNPVGSAGRWGGLDPWAGSCLRPSLGCCCLLKALAGDGGVRCLDKALPSQHFLRWALFIIAGAPCALPGDGGCHPLMFSQLLASVDPSACCCSGRGDRESPATPG